jgi:multiple sugar transport system permease protein
MSALWLLAMGLILFTLIAFDANARLYFDILVYRFPNLYVPPLVQQMAAGGGAALTLLGIAAAVWGRRRLRAAETDHERLAGLLQVIIIALGVVLVILFFYFAAAITYDHAAAQAVRALERSEVEAAGMAVTGLERQAFRAAYGSINGDGVAAALVAWPQVVLILAGLLLLYGAYRVWQGAARSEGGMRITAFLLLTVLAAIGGWLLIGELPQAMAVGDADYYESLIVTVAYATGTVPVQIGLGLLIAYILFYEIRIGRSLYRMIYFMPYVAPTVATATVFVIIFSRRDTSLANQVIGLLNVPPQAWLSESKGIFQLIANAIAGTRTDLPSFLVGPSLALLSVILYGTWVFSGYNAVIFLAGLGSIPAELYEAAKVDGAGRWQAFRKITLPLLSPTTFFLIILGTIGTFQAFNHIYVLRKAEAQGTADTATVHIFIQFWTYNQWGYASAMAFVLFGVILLMTLVQNEVSKERVFYG